jgi:16S rRNA (uracil1498-N3)-methyltransferase
MQLFFVPQITVGLVDLPPEEARHAVQVLRKRVGDTLDIVDGQGGWYQATIVETSKRSCTVQVEKIRQEEKRANYRLVMAVSPTKSNDRFEWFLEKATEIGVDVIIPLQCARTERPKIRHDRYEKVLVSAMKQSLQAWLPELRPFTRFDKVVEEFTAKHAAFIGWCNEEVKSPLANNYSASSDVLMLVGPEGDFTDAEVQLARDHGCQPVTLGPTRLRTETAAIVATQTIALINQTQES